MCESCTRIRLAALYVRIHPVQREIAKTHRVEEFSSLAQFEMPVIYRFLLASLRDKDLAETMTQECFLRAYRSRSTFRGESSTRTWLMRIAINLQKDHWRNRRMQFWRETLANSVDMERTSDLLPSAERSPEAQVIAREQAAKIWKMVEKLSMRERSVFLMRYVEELELREIGHCTGLKVGAVKVYLARAQTKIRKALKDRDMY
ncbi:MAG TPA: sigma-70 family RNA polymerase sigma factor [Terracidiphilus sp.]|jgi:RNA polymerase sigma-70 factor (ECF subfamily)